MGFLDKVRYIDGGSHSHPARRFVSVEEENMKDKALERDIAQISNQELREILSSGDENAICECFCRQVGIKLIVAICEKAIENEINLAYYIERSLM